MNRRGLLKLLGLGGAAAALPAPAAVEVADEYMIFAGPRPAIFEGSVGIYNGVIIRQVDMLPPLDLNECCRGGLREWYEGEQWGSKNER